MSSRSRVVMGALAALAATLAAARPQRDVPRMELADVVGHTVCPLKVLVDEDPLRLPRRIKYLTCDRAAPRACPAASGAPGACCHARARRRDITTQCVEVFDNVLVEFLSAAGGSNTTQHVVQVPVGCACVVLPATAAEPDV